MGLLCLLRETSARRSWQGEPWCADIDEKINGLLRDALRECTKRTEGYKEYIVPKTVALYCTRHSLCWIRTETVQAELPRPLLPLRQVALGLREHKEKVNFSDLR